ncbi:enolase C-terminal domain-like protein [Pseudonocardia spinosispora]|uniref:enolase C-terminal domain-like protein n=1 Tax=Pseudonocardia spinosispora TaxID=103441 RepID=UPI00048F4C09|nr:enolase C-terminal domain-like protein [Pseudonocardia spinosispora]
MEPPLVRFLKLDPVRVSARTTWLLLSLTTTDGTVRRGECSDAGSLPSVAGWVDELASLLVSVPLAEVAERLDRWVGAADRFGRRTVAGGVLTAVEADGWRASGPVRLYANINRATVTRTPDGFAELARRAVADGFGWVKLAPFDGLTGADRARAGLDCARAVRAEIGGSVGLMVDVHELLDDGELDTILPALAELDLTWLEDAAELHRVDRLARIREVVGCPLAGGERLDSIAEAVPALRAGALDVVLPDIKHAGGPSRAFALATSAARHGAEVSLHNPSGPVATSTSAAVMERTGSALPLEFMFGEHPERAELVGSAERIRDGSWTPTRKKRL